MWWTSLERILAKGPRELIAHLLEYGDWNDAHAPIAHVDRDAVARVLADPPPGMMTERSRMFWHCRLGLKRRTRRLPGRKLPR